MKKLKQIKVRRKDLYIGVFNTRHRSSISIKPQTAAHYCMQ